MNQNISAAETLFSAAHPDIKKITNISALILSLLFCAVGLCLLFFSSKVEDSSSASGPVLLVGGIAFLVAGGIRLMIRKKESDIRSDRQFGEKRFLFLRCGRPLCIGAVAGGEDF